MDGSHSIPSVVEASYHGELGAGNVHRLETTVTPHEAVCFPICRLNETADFSTTVYRAGKCPSCSRVLDDLEGVLVKGGRDSLKTRDAGGTTRTRAGEKARAANERDCPKRASRGHPACG